MIQFPQANLYRGSLADLSQTNEREWAFVHATQTIHYISYSSLLIFNGIILYIWIYEYIQKKRAFKPEFLIPNLMNSMQATGFLKPLDLKV